MQLTTSSAVALALMIFGVMATFAAHGLGHVLTGLLMKGLAQ
jgi:vacuolar-type H+-ATPase subunit I/STV1